MSSAYHKTFNNSMGFISSLTNDCLMIVVTRFEIVATEVQCLVSRKHHVSACFIIYKCTITFTGMKKNYFSSNGNDFKSQYYTDQQSFAHRDKINDATELSKVVWCTKNICILQGPQIKWSMPAKSFLHQPKAKSRNLCQKEKLAILNANPATTRNKISNLLQNAGTKTRI